MTMAWLVNSSRKTHSLNAPPFCGTFSVDRFYEPTDNTERRNGHCGRRTTEREVNKESHHGRSPDVVSRVRRFRGARLVLQIPRETQSRARKNRHPCRDR